MTPNQFTTVALLAILTPQLALSQTTPLPQAPAPQTLALTTTPSIPLSIPHSDNPLAPYRPDHVAPANLFNSSRIDTLVHNGTLELTLQDAIALALENNLDLAIARYNIPIAKADVLRTRAGGTFRGVNTGIVANTPGAGVGGFGSGGSGAGAGGTTGGAGGAGGGAGGLVQSTLGTGTAVQSYDPAITGDLGYQSTTQPLSNLSTFGVPTLQSHAFSGDIGYAQAFPIGLSLTASYAADRATNNSPYTFLNPELDSSFLLQARQHLLAGRGLGPNLRFLRIAENNQRISDEAFQLQVVSTVTQIANIYWDLVAAYEDERVKTSSLDFANQTLASAKQQLALQAIPALDVLKDQAEVANREGDLAIAKSQLQFQSLLIKNALTKNLDDPILEAMPVRPLDVSTLNAPIAPDPNSPSPVVPEQDPVADALTRRLELSESAIDLQNRQISLAGARNALLPTVDLVANYGGAGLAGAPNATGTSTTTSTAPPGYGGAFANTFSNANPTYFVGVSVSIPIRNRIAKSDQYRSELETRQSEIREQQLRKQIRIEVRNAQYALDQAGARVASLQQARDLAQKLFDISTQEQSFGAGSALQTLGARRDLAQADSNLVAARTAYQKSRVELDRATGQTLTANAISIDAARLGTAGIPVNPPAPVQNP